MEKNIANWFEIPAKDFDRAKTFYGKVFDVELQDIPNPNMKVAAFPMIQGAEFSTGAIVQGEHLEPSMSGTTVYLTCTDVATTLAKLETLGGKTLVPKTAIGEFGFIGHFTDTEGNKVGLHSEK